MSKVTITLSALLNSSFTDVFSKAKGYIKGFKDSINSSMFSTLGAAQMAGNAIGYVKNTLSAVMQEAKQFEKTGIKFGVDPSEVAKLGKLAEETMTPLKSLYKGFNQLKGAAAEALSNPKSEMGEAFKQLGISAAQLRSGLAEPKVLMGQVSDAINKISDDAERQSAITAIFKANGYALAGVLELTAEEQRNLLAGHSTMSDTVIAQNAAMEDTWSRMWDAIKTGMGILGLVLNPIVQILSILINVVTALATLLGGALYVTLINIGGLFISLLGVIAYIISAVVKLIGVFGKFLGLGDGLDEFSNKMLEFSENMIKGGVGGSLDMSKKVGDGMNEAIQGDIQDIKRAGGHIGAGYGSQQAKKSREGGGGKFEDPAEKQKKIDEANKAQVEAQKKAAEAQKEERDALLEMTKMRLKAQMEAKGASETEIENALLLKDIEYTRNKWYAATGAEKVKHANDIAKLELQIVENNKKAKLKAEEEIRKKRTEYMKEQMSLVTSIEDVGKQLKIQAMEQAGMSETEIKKAQFDDELAKAEKLDAEYKAMLAARGGVEDKDTLAMKKEVVDQQGKVVLAAGEMQLAGRASVGVNADTMRKIGGGGTAIESGGNGAIELSKKQLASIDAMKENIAKLVAIVEKRGLPVSERGREIATNALIEQGLGSDNKPTK